MSHELVVRGGTIIDGSGAPRFRADVGIREGRIETIGRIPEKGAEELDAEGLFVAPGFIEGHTHMDAQINWDPLGTSSCYHGVTTVIMGNCGFTLAPMRSGREDLVFRSIERAEEVSRDAMLAGIKWDWESFPEYLAAMDRLPKGINYGVYVGHSSLRTYVMGDRAYDEEASEDDLLLMCRELEAALRAGAIGFSTSRSSSHMTSDDRPVASRLSSWSELVQLTTVMRDLGTGLFEIDHEKHLPGEGRDEYRERVIQLASGCGRPLFSMLVVPNDEPDYGREALAFLDKAAEVGARLFGQVHSHELTNVFGFEVNLPFDMLPGWAGFRTQDLFRQNQDLRDLSIRTNLVQEALFANYGLYGNGRSPDFDRTYLLDPGDEPKSSLAEIARERGITPVDLMIDLSLERDLKLLFYQVTQNPRLDEVLELLRHPRTVVGVADSGAHVKRICDSSIPTHLLSHWVREQEAFTWERAIQMLTGTPARAYGLSGRGQVREGLIGDLVVFDPETIAPNPPYLDHDLPTGATRLKRTAEGIEATVVNGSIVLRRGEPTGANPGSLVRGKPTSS